MDMRRIIFCIFLLMTVMMGFSKVTKPDFAFPKTVAEEAYKDLNAADNKHDAHAALNALIRIAVAQNLIERDSLQSVIRLVYETSRKYNDDPLSGLYHALLADLYYSYYESRMWYFDRRETPLEPYPDNMSEWSGQQFKKIIKEEASASFSGKCGEDLGKLYLKDYEDLFTIGELTTTYYPTLLDFCYSNATEIANFDVEFCNEITKTAYESSLPGSPQNVLWVWSYEIMKIKSSGRNIGFDTLYDMANAYSSNKYAGMIIQYLASFVVKDDMTESRKYINLATNFINTFPESPFKNSIKDYIEQLKTPRTKITTISYCSPGNAFDVKVTAYNADKFDLNIYFTGSTPMNEWGSKLYDSLLKKKPENKITLKFNDELPFKRDTTLSLSLDKPGYYYIAPVFGKKNIQTYRVNSVRCIPVYPLAVSSDNLADIITVDPYTGVPLKDVGVSITNTYRRNNQSTKKDCGITDSDGVVDVFNCMKEDNGYYITATTGDKSYKFDNVTIYRDGKQKRNVTYRANVLTDRLLYHPGDSTDVLVIMSTATPGADNKIHQALSERRDLSIILFDANYQPVDTAEVTTDEWGRATASFLLPSDGMTGEFHVEVKDKASNDNIGYRRITVSDYRMPDFEIKIDETACDEPSKGFVTIKGTATSYSGMPMPDANITLGLSESSWGWWKWRNNQAKIYSQETNTDGQGKFIFIVPDTVLTNRDKLYMASIDGVSITGSTAQASTAFSLTKKYDITVNLPGINIDGEKLLYPDVKVYAPDGSTVDIPLEWALIHDNDTTAFAPYKGVIDLSKVKPANYILIIKSVEEDLAESANSQITVYNKSTDIVPEDFVLWAPVTSYIVGPDGQAEVAYANAYDDTYIYFYITNGEKTERPTLIKSDKGYHTFRLSLAKGEETAKLNMYAVRKGECKRSEVILKRDTKKGLKITGESFRDNLIPGAKETWKIRITDGTGNQCQSALVLDMYNQALDAITSQRQSMYFPTYDYTGYLRCNFLNNAINNCTYNQIFSGNGNYISITAPEFLLNPFKGGIQIYGSRSPRKMLSLSMMDEFELSDDAEGVVAVAEVSNEMKAEAPMVRGYSINGNMKMAMADMAAGMEEEAEEAIATGTGGATEEASIIPETFDYRDSDVPMAIWAPLLTTDKDGAISYTFTVPNANTTWRLQAVAWSRDMEVGSMMRDFVASKPVMVQPNLPRFLRNGDTATVVASVMNNTDTEQKVTTTVEIFNPLTNDLMMTKTFTQTIDPKGYDKVSVNIIVDEDVSAIGYRIRSTNGDFADGEQSVIRVLPSEQAIIETQPFYLNPGEKEYTTTLPDDEGARISLTFCENPAWTIVSALPGLRTQIQEYANSAAAAIYSAAISRGIVKDNPKIGDMLKMWIENPENSALVSMLEKNEDLKIAVLNATPWVSAAQSQNERMANLAMIFNDNENAKTTSAAIKILKDLQNSDGGWAWAKWCNESSVWATSNVLAMLGDLRRIGWMPADKELSDMVTRAVNYYDRKVEKTDLIYCLVRPLFSTPVSANGRKVINATLAEIKKNWKSYSDPAYKAMAAQALYLNDNKKLASELMRSLSEFGVYTKSQGLRFPNVNALYNYAIILDAYSIINPDSKDVDGLRQQLIVRKQGTDWGDDVVTMEVVKAILTSGSKWTVDAAEANVTAGGEEIISKSTVEKATGSFTADLSDYAGKELKVTTPGVGPAYGAVYSQFNRQMDKVEASGCDDLDIDKQLFVRRGMDWETAESLKVGDRVKVQLTIHCKRNLQYVSIIDNRPATFEPVKQLPGWEWSEGVGFYRENRDSQTDLHVVYMSPGTYLLTYEMNVNLAGNFTSGVASIQSQHAPEISAHSGGEILKVGF